MLKKILEKALANLKSRGEAMLADSVKKLSSTAEEQAAVILQRGEQMVREKLTELQKTVADKIDPRLAELFNIKAGNNDAYSVIITDDPNHPFQINDAIKNQAAMITRGAQDDLSKAKAIFNWFEQHINYGDKKRPHDVGYRNSKEVFTDLEGVCGEMAVLYVVMARSVGLKTNFVHVTVDSQGKAVQHACVVIYRGGEVILADPSYHTFNAKHQEFAVKTDVEAVPLLKAFRKIRVSNPSNRN